jgi:hypothetical protein
LLGGGGANRPPNPPPPPPPPLRPCPLQLPLGRDLVAASPQLLGLFVIQLGPWRLTPAVAVAHILASALGEAAACVAVDARARLGFLTGGQQQEQQQGQRRQQLAGACGQQGCGPSQE